MPPVSVTIFASDPGIYYLEDDGIPGNNFSRIRFPDGTFVAFEHPTNALIFDPSVAGVTLVVDLVETLGTSQFSTGDFADPLATPDQILVRNLVTGAGVTLISNGAITEYGADTAADIVASTLILSSTTGVGTAGNSLETQVGVIEAEATTGGINLRNYGNVSIGGLTDQVDGLDVITSGNLSFLTFGLMLISDDTGPESIHGGTTSGNVTLTASGVDSDILANVDQDSISAPAGDITLTAGRDIGFGLIGSNFDNDVRASGNIVFNPGRDFLLDGFADVASDNFGNATGGDVIVNAGRNVTVLAVTGTDAGIEASGVSGGNIVLNTGPGGTVTLNSGNGTAPFASLISQTGGIFINADRMSIGVNGAISTVSGQVTIQPRTEGWEVDLGSATDTAFALELSDAEIDRIFTNTLSLGGFGSGQLTVTSAISPLNAFGMALRAGTDIGINASMTIGGFLTLQAADNFFQLPASAINLGGAFSAFIDELGDDGNLGGFGILNGSVTASAIALNGNAENDLLSGTGNGETLTGGAGNDTLIGFGGNDTLIGGLGIDTMTGGFGDDFFFVDSAGDLVVESVGEGANDRVFAGVSYTLAAGVEVERLTTDNNLGTAAINLTGNEFDNLIFGNAGANTLDGGVNADALIGFGGNDFYFVDNALDSVTEGAADGAADRILASVNYTMGVGVFVELLSTTSSAGVTAINLTGNELVNTIMGNAGANVLDGKGGSDGLVGLGGDDFFYVDSAGDVVVEGAGEGANDRVLSSVTYTLAAGVHVERLTTDNNAGVGAIDLTGNEFANIIFGNAGANALDGSTGVDTLIGLGGNDFLYVDSAGDAVVEGVAEGAADRILASVNYTMGAGVFVEILSTTNSAGLGALNLTGNEVANTILGNSGSNILDGKGGGDVLAGNAGQDVFAFTTALGAGNVDTISGFVVVDDRIHVDNAVFTGLAAGALAPGAFNTGVAATQADDRIIYNNATGVLLFDVDGVGGAAGVHFATISTGLALTAGDFFVI